MLVLETVLRIRREHASGKAIKAIARDLHLSRKVVRKAIRAPEADMGYRREVQPLPKLGPFQARLDALLEEDEARPRREKLRLTPISRSGFRTQPQRGKVISLPNSPSPIGRSIGSISRSSTAFPKTANGWHSKPGGKSG